MSIDPNNADNDAEILVGRFKQQLAAVTDADQALARMPQPIAPSGGRHEARVKDTLETAATWRDRLRAWTPALAGTVIFLVLLFSPAPMTGPLIVYALGWAVFGLWTTLGRPGVRDTCALAARRAAAVGGLGSAAWGMV